MLPCEPPAGHKPESERHDQINPALLGASCYLEDQGTRYMPRSDKDHMAPEHKADADVSFKQLRRQTLCLPVETPAAGKKGDRR